MKSLSRSSVDNLFWSQEFRDLDAANQFHDEVRPAGFSGPGIQNFRDVWMIHQRQRLTLGFEAGDDLLGVHAQLDHLERHAAVNRLFLFGHVNHTATALADLLKQFVSSDLVAGFFGEGNGHHLCSHEVETRGWRFQEIPGLFVRLDQFLDALTENRVAGTGLVEIGGALRFAECQRRVKDGCFPVRLFRSWVMELSITQCAKEKPKGQPHSPIE